MATLLQARNLRAFYSQAEVLHGIDFAIDDGGITTILGANGAGKTTTLRAVCGMVRTLGEISFDARRIDGRRTEEIVRSSYLDPMFNGSTVGPGYDGKFYYLAQTFKAIVELTPVPAPQA